MLKAATGAVQIAALNNVNWETGVDGFNGRGDGRGAHGRFRIKKKEGVLLKGGGGKRYGRQGRCRVLAHVEFYGG